MANQQPVRFIDAGLLNVAYLETGPPNGLPVILLHGFPYDVHSYHAVAAKLAAAERRVIVPWLRGFGPARFLSADTPRVGQQAALGGDLLALIDALTIEQTTLTARDARRAHEPSAAVECGQYEPFPSTTAGTVSAMIRALNATERLRA